MGEIVSFESVFVEVPRERVQEVLGAIHTQKLCGYEEVLVELKALKAEMTTTRKLFLAEIDSVGAKVIAFEKQIVQALRALVENHSNMGRSPSDKHSPFEAHSQTSPPQRSVKGKGRGSPCTPQVGVKSTTKSMQRKRDVLGTAIEVFATTMERHTSFPMVADVGYATLLRTFPAGPYKLVAEPSPIDIAILEYIFDEHLDDSEIVIRTTNYPVSRRSVKTISPNECVDDFVISAKVDLLVWEQKKIDKAYPLTWFLPTDFAQAVLSRGFDMNEFVRLQKYKEKYMYDFHRSMKINIPVHDSLLKHWYLLVVLVREGRAEIWDPLDNAGDTRNYLSQARLILQKLDKVLATEIVEHMPPEFVMFENFSIMQKLDACKQSNNVDCGPFVMKYMESPKTMSKKSYKWISHEDRYRLIMNIFTSPVNTVQYQVTDLARRHSFSKDLVMHGTPLSGYFEHPRSSHSTNEDNGLVSREGYNNPRVKKKLHLSYLN